MNWSSIVATSYLFQPMIGVKSKMVEVMNLSKQRVSKANTNKIRERKFVNLLISSIVFNLFSIVFVVVLELRSFCRLFGWCFCHWEIFCVQMMHFHVWIIFLLDKSFFRICQMFLNEFIELNAWDERSMNGLKRHFHSVIYNSVNHHSIVVCNNEDKSILKLIFGKPTHSFISCQHFQLRKTSPSIHVSCYFLYQTRVLF